MCCTLIINMSHTVETFYKLVKCSLHAVHELVLQFVYLENMQYIYMCGGGEAGLCKG